MGIRRANRASFPANPACEGSGRYKMLRQALTRMVTLPVQAFPGSQSSGLRYLTIVPATRAALRIARSSFRISPGAYPLPQT